MAAAGLEAPVGDLGVMIERTKATLGRLVSKPPMRDKLLGRPPFRFVHDAVTAVTDATGFLRGAFSGPELEPKSMERDEKLHYLTKLLDLLGKALGKPLGVDPMKVAAGKDPEMTNYMLQVRPSQARGAQRGGPDARAGKLASEQRTTRSVAAILLTLATPGRAWLPQICLQFRSQPRRGACSKTAGDGSWAGHVATNCCARDSAAAPRRPWHTAQRRQLLRLHLASARPRPVPRPRRPLLRPPLQLRPLPRLASARLLPTRPLRPRLPPMRLASMGRTT